MISQKLFTYALSILQVLQESFRNVTDGLSEEFVIDKTLGRDIKFTLDLPGSGNITGIQILNSNGDVFYEINADISGTISIHLEQLEVTKYFVATT